MIQKNDPILTAFVLGEVDDEQRQCVEQAMAESPELREEIKAIRATTDLLGQSLPSAPCPELTPDQRQVIQQESVEPAVAAPVAGSSAATSAGPAAAATMDTRPATPSGGWKLRSLAIAACAVAASIALITVAVVPNPQFFAVSQRNSGDAVNATSESEVRDSATLERGDESAAEYSSDSSPYDAGVMAEPADQDDLAMPGIAGGGRPIDDEYSARSTSEQGGGFASGRPGRQSPRSDAMGDRYSSRFGPRTPGPAVPGEENLEGSDSGRGETAPRATDLPAQATTSPTNRPGDALGLDSTAPATPSDGAAPPATQPATPSPSSAEPADDTPHPTSGDGSFGGQRPEQESLAENEPMQRQGERLSGQSEGRVGESEEEAQREKKSESLKLKETNTPGSNTPEKPKTWVRAKSTPNASRLMVGDQDDLPLEGMQVNVMVDGFRARVLLDLYFYNNRNRQLEGSFKLRLPNEASLYYFAFGQTTFEYRPMVDSLASKGFLTPDLVRASGTGPQEIFQARSATWRDVKEARIVPREKAALAYSEVVRRRVDPALVEWSGAGVFNAKVFPLMPNKLHRVVVGYDVNLQRDGSDLHYQLELPEQLSQCAVDLDVSALPGTTATVTPETRPFVSGGRAFYHFDDPAVRSVDVRFKTPGSILLTGKDAGGGEYFATRITPDLPAESGDAASSHAIFLVDTSLSSNPDKFNVWLKMLESILAKNEDSIEQFAVLFFNVETHWWKDSFTKNTSENVRAVLNHCATLSLEGATDLRAALAEAGAPRWQDDQQKTAAPDLFLLSDGAATWGETQIHQIAETLKSGNHGALFAYKTGLTGTAIGELETLARESGGSVFSVVNEQEVDQAATAHRSRPWQLLDIGGDGASDLLVAGRPRFIYPGQTLLVAGRGQPQDAMHLHVRRGQDDRDLTIPLERVVQSELAARVYGQVAVGQLEDWASATEDVSVAYARHFRVTGRTCSLLMLESEADYQRFNIKPEDDLFVVKSSPADALIRQTQDEMAQRIADPKEAVKAWLAKMENTPGVTFKIPTALRLVVERLPRSAFSVNVPPLDCKKHDKEDLPKPVFEMLASGELNYDVISAEANRRREKYGTADALKALSSLIEANPGDPVLARDVAYSAIHWGMGGHAFSLLQKVAAARPYQPQIYQALGQCLADLGNADLAMIYYEVAMHGQWHSRYQDFHQIATVEYLHLLQKIAAGELQSHAAEYANARLEALAQATDVDGSDLVIVMMWNTDRTDVDLHVREPSGEECFYKNRNTRAGGRVTRDVTEGFGPEMYWIHRAPRGKYQILANYFGTDTNRTQVRSKVYVTVYEMFGSKQERVTKHAVTLSENKEKREIATVSIDK